MKRFFILIFIGLVFAGGYFYRDTAYRWYQAVISPKTVRDFNAAKDALQEVVKRVSTPEPLRATKESSESFLTEKGVIAWTNSARRNNGGLSALTENARLRAAALAKVDDMFARQYFEHISPTGRGPADLAKDAEYEYIAIGENLALGNFENDEVLVTAWMNSPGHRANILNAKYTEIGVAVKRGTFEGRQVWLAVQEFGAPLSLCPVPDDALKLRIDSLEQEARILLDRIEALEKEIEQTPRRRDSGYNEKVEEYNALVKEYNDRIAVIKDLIARYNAATRAFNECIQ